MAILVRSNVEGSHWYTHDGESCHTIKRADGDGERAVTVADARKLKLLPSVTNVLGVLHKPQLETHKIAAAVKAAMANPKQADESDEYYIKRIIDASKEDVRGAADLGTRIHDAIDKMIGGEGYDQELSQFVEPVRATIAENKWNIHTREVVLVNSGEGYAGRVDAIFDSPSGFGIIDFKTRKTKAGQKCTPYDGQAEQLAAYARAHYGKDASEIASLINIYISTTEPGRVEVYEHPESMNYWRQFKAACVIWRGMKHYDPRVR